VVENENDAEIRAALIAAARAQIGREDTSHFNIRGLCEEAGISKAEFRRFFPGKEALIAAVLNDDVAQLQEIAGAVAEPRASLAVANGPSISAPPPDAWLERRLRVFERALTGLETRQEKTEQLLNRSVALLEEKIARPPERFVIPTVAPATVSVPVPARVRAPVVAERPVMEPVHTEPELDEFSAKVTPMPAMELDLQPPVSPQEMEDLLANARRVAREAVVEPPALKPKRVPRWMAWVAVGCLAMMALTAVVIGTMAGASVGGGVSHRLAAPPTLAQMTSQASKGDARSQAMLAFTYLNARHDTASALRWGLAAAKQGVPMAQYLTATLYQDGASVTADAHQAFGWFEAAALRGNVKAMHDLAIAYAEGQGTAHDPSRAAAWFNRAAKQGYVDSQFDLAVLYERGDGVRQNPQAALKWYLVAAGAGDAQARNRASQLASEMRPADVAQAKDAAENFMPTERDQAANTL
jgi:AcrR family transcriptional regulator